MKHFSGEIAVSVVLLALLFILFNPFGVFMPGYVVMGLLLGAVVSFGVFSIFLWREGEGDERENLHRMFADRIAYLTGSGLLLAGIVVQELSHSLDPWLIYALAAMIIAKVVARIYSKTNL